MNENMREKNMIAYIFAQMRENQRDSQSEHKNAIIEIIENADTNKIIWLSLFLHVSLNINSWSSPKLHEHLPVII